ncbi:hypothetical protein EON66_08585 [archaeon]|nr:MAG: hypothetical protein EON66_08585 [archaeon]
MLRPHYMSLLHLRVPSPAPPSPPVLLSTPFFSAFLARDTRWCVHDMVPLRLWLPFHPWRARTRSGCVVARSQWRLAPACCPLASRDAVPRHIFAACAMMIQLLGQQAGGVGGTYSRVPRLRAGILKRARSFFSRHGAAHAMLGRAFVRSLATRSQLAARAAAAAVPFSSRVTHLLRDVSTGVQAMTPYNAGMAIQSGSGSGEGTELTIRLPDAADFQLYLDEDGDEPVLVYVSPKAGRQSYTLKLGVAGEVDGIRAWVSTVDGHLLADLLTRDLIYYGKGYPTW